MSFQYCNGRFEKIFRLFKISLLNLVGLFEHKINSYKISFFLAKNTVQTGLVSDERYFCS